MENFIQFCRRLGVHENLLFESDDLGKNQALLIPMHASQTGAMHAVRLIELSTRFANRAARTLVYL